MKNKTTDKVRVMMERILHSEESFFASYVIEYERDAFFSQNKSISDWFKKLSNSKAKTAGIMNREWFRRILNGFYKYEISADVIKIWLVFETDARLHDIDLFTRIKKIRPHPKCYELVEGDLDNLVKNYGTLFFEKTGFEVFGALKRK